MISTDRTCRGREARKACVLRYAGSGDQAIVMVESAADGPGDELAVDGLLAGQLGRRIGNPVNALVDASRVVPASVFGDGSAKLPLVPHEDAVQQLPTQCADEPLDMGVGLSCRMHPMETLRNDVSG